MGIAILYTILSVVNFAVIRSVGLILGQLSNNTYSKIGVSLDGLPFWKATTFANMR